MHIEGTLERYSGSVVKYAYVKYSGNYMGWQQECKKKSCREVAVKSDSKVIWFYSKISMTMEVKEFWIFDKIILNLKEGVEDE